MNAELFAKQFQSKKALLECREKRLEIECELINAKNRANEMMRELQVIQADRITLIKDCRQRALEEFINAKREPDGLHEQLAKVGRRNYLIQIFAPADGVISKLQNFRKALSSVKRKCCSP